MTLGERIQQIRVKNHLTQDAFGEILGTTRQSVSKWENDQTLPELGKIVKIARLFGVSTDSLLLGGISTFEDENEPFRCRVCRGNNEEIVLTERFALHCYEVQNPRRIGCRLYTGNRIRKSCVAAAEHDFESDTTSAAGMYEDGTRWLYGGNRQLADMVEKEFSADCMRYMETAETFLPVSLSEPLPKTADVGIAAALRTWRMGAEYTNTSGMCMLHLCTAETEYIFQIRPDFEDVYIGASRNFPFELGLFAGEQYFRIRDSRIREDYCNSHANFTSRRRDVKIPTEYAKLGQCVSTPQGLMWCLKRYDDDEIVLEGCGGDEYVYSRKADFAEHYSAD